MGTLTDVVIKTKESAAEFCSWSDAAYSADLTAELTLVALHHNPDLGSNTLID
jgi:hypothetical protein